ncbi:MAG TPA: FMN-binding protein [Thiotrichales bacterium]|nr:FMN-binding protein [Thiotrichales bacterium]
MNYPNKVAQKIIWPGFFCLAILLCASQPAFSKGVYKTNEQFLQEIFHEGIIPETQVIWLSGDLKDEIKNILGHPYDKLRVKYWQKKNRTAWVLEEIGKEKPITVGFVVNDNELENVEVLAFRESRGWEIKHPFFTRQFKGVALKNKSGLNKNIDGITGATLSVSAMTRLSQMALYLHQHVTAQ